MQGARRSSAVMVGAVVAGLAAIVLASRRLPGDRTRAAFAADLDDRLLLAVFVLMVVGGTALVVWSAWPDGERKPAVAPKSWWHRYLASLAVMLLFVLAGAIRERAAHERERTQRLERAAERGDDRATAGEGDRLPPSTTASLAIAVTVTAVAVAAVARAMARRRAEALGLTTGDPGRLSGPQPDDEARLAALPEGFDEADLTDEPDPRRAVQLAYALLERRLDGTPSARPASATPGEWLAVLRRADPDAATPARRLTALYEQARFGGTRHPIAEEDRDAAVAAVRSLTVLLRPEVEVSTSTGGRGSR